MKPTHSHLAWHETLELHELVAAQSNALMKLKKAYPKVKDPILKTIYKQMIDTLTQNIIELLKFYPLAPKTERDDEEEEQRDNISATAAGDLLGLAKSSINNYATALTETATPSLRKVFKKHLNGAIDNHAKIFNYLYERNLYPAYDFNQLLQNDVNVANKALSQQF
ncbi:spore coat protein [Peribacillus butanolivorans]|uniref:spore coat protein n=1 Tax=Peribacillus butanolivorans TaxID=421767 RepID=UPI0006F353C8|nr:spore coat protein [Peribacillus butanolivorans]KQU24742.1 spore coat protein [Bacillus sp. Leaf13]KRF65956.1 spore coat protein [Bacillus sp. Soil768D1]MCO0598310.1 spore coat protein [Peribacillus butanolivorans]